MEVQLEGVPCRQNTNQAQLHNALIMDSRSPSCLPLTRAASNSLDQVEGSPCSIESQHQQHHQQHASLSSPLPSPPSSSVPSAGLTPDVLVSLSGVWEGVSQPDNPVQLPTKWQECRLRFHANGNIDGAGHSAWKQQLIQFKLVGRIVTASSAFELYKTHLGQFTNTLVYHGHLRLDVWPVRMEGSYRGGKLLLTRCSHDTSDLPPATSSSNGSNSNSIGIGNSNQNNHNNTLACIPLPISPHPLALNNVTASESLNTKNPALDLAIVQTMSDAVHKHAGVSRISEAGYIPCAGEFRMSDAASLSALSSSLSPTSPSPSTDNSTSIPTIALPTYSQNSNSGSTSTSTIQPNQQTSIQPQGTTQPPLCRVVSTPQPHVPSSILSRRTPSFDSLAVRSPPVQQSSFVAPAPVSVPSASLIAPLPIASASSSLLSNSVDHLHAPRIRPSFLAAPLAPAAAALAAATSASSPQSPTVTPPTPLHISMQGRASSCPVERQKHDSNSALSCFVSSHMPPPSSSLPSTLSTLSPAPVSSPSSSSSTSSAPSSSSTSSASFPSRIRTALSLLSGIWEGQSVNRATSQIQRFKHTLIHFTQQQPHTRTGHVSGNGHYTVGRSGVMYPFVLQGWFNLDSMTVMISTSEAHTQAQAQSTPQSQQQQQQPQHQGTVTTTYHLLVDVNKLTMKGNFEDGKIVLTHTKQYTSSIPLTSFVTAPPRHHALPHSIITSSQLLSPVPVDSSAPSSASPFVGSVSPLPPPPPPPHARPSLHPSLSDSALSLSLPPSSVSSPVTHSSIVSSASPLPPGLLNADLSRPSSFNRSQRQTMQQPTLPVAQQEQQGQQQQQQQQQQQHQAELKANPPADEEKEEHQCTAAPMPDPVPSPVSSPSPEPDLSSPASVAVAPPPSIPSSLSSFHSLPASNGAAVAAAAAASPPSASIGADVLDALMVGLDDEKRALFLAGMLAANRLSQHQQQTLFTAVQASPAHALAATAAAVDEKQTMTGAAQKGSAALAASAPAPAPAPAASGVIAPSGPFVATGSMAAAGPGTGSCSALNSLGFVTAVGCPSTGSGSSAPSTCVASASPPLAAAVSSSDHGGGRCRHRDDVDCDSDSDLCKICYVHPQNCVLIPCGHLVICIECSRRIDRCPCCRVPLTEAKIIFRS